jgi:hypothetical protein
MINITASQASDVRAGAGGLLELDVVLDGDARADGMVLLRISDITVLLVSAWLKQTYTTDRFPARRRRRIAMHPSSPVPNSVIEPGSGVGVSSPNRP